MFCLSKKMPGLSPPVIYMSKYTPWGLRLLTENSTKLFMYTLVSFIENNFRRTIKTMAFKVFTKLSYTAINLWLDFTNFYKQMLLDGLKVKKRTVVILLVQRNLHKYSFHILGFNKELKSTYSQRRTTSSRFFSAILVFLCIDLKDQLVDNKCFQNNEIDNRIYK